MENKNMATTEIHTMPQMREAVAPALDKIKIDPTLGLVVIDFEAIGQGTIGRIVKSDLGEYPVGTKVVFRRSPSQAMLGFVEDPSGLRVLRIMVWTRQILATIEE